jgi:HlyD family secretion protein
VQGELLRFDVEEGMTLNAGAQVGVIDTTLLSLQAKEIAANREAIASQNRNVAAQIAVQDARMADLLREQQRLARTCSPITPPPGSNWTTWPAKWPC